MSISPEFDAFAARYDAGRPQVVSTTLVADLDTPVSAYLKLADGRANSFLLESVEGGSVRGRYSIIGFKPDVIWRCTKGKVEINRRARTDTQAFEPLEGRPLETLRLLIRECQMELPPGLPPMASGLFGFLGYDMVRDMERLPDTNPDPIGLPDARGRLQVLRIHARKKLLGPRVDLEQLALDTPGLSGAELANVVNEAALAAARRGAAAVEQDDFDSALDRILYGLKRPPLPDRLAPKRHMAIYEAGTGVLCEVLRIREREEKRRRKEAKDKEENSNNSSSSSSSSSSSPSIFSDDSGSMPLNAEAVERLSIAPRGDSWSRTILARRGDAAAFVVTRARVEARLQILLAGHAAETLLCGKEGPSTYAAKLKALDRARMLAEKALGEYGFYGSSASARKGGSSSSSSSSPSSSSSASSA